MTLASENYLRQIKDDLHAIRTYLETVLSRDRIAPPPPPRETAKPIKPFLDGPYEK